MNDQLALRRLVDARACALDGREPVRSTDGRLIAHQPDAAPMGERSGPQELVKNHVAEVDGDTATGTAYCLAHHCTPGSGDSGTDLALDA